MVISPTFLALTPEPNSSIEGSIDAFLALTTKAFDRASFDEIDIVDLRPAGPHTLEPAPPPAPPVPSLATQGSITLFHLHNQHANLIPLPQSPLDLSANEHCIWCTTDSHIQCSSCESSRFTTPPSPSKHRVNLFTSDPHPVPLCTTVSTKSTLRDLEPNSLPYLNFVDKTEKRKERRKFRIRTQFCVGKWFRIIAGVLVGALIILIPVIVFLGIGKSENVAV